MKHTKTLVFMLVGSLIAFWAGTKITYQVRSQIHAGKDPLKAVGNFYADLANPLHFPTDKADLIGGAVAVVIILLIVAYNMAGKKNYRQGEEHGSATWGTKRDIVPFINKEPRKNLLFTQSERLSLDSKATQRNLNALVIGSSGSGKSRYYVLPNLAQKNMSYVITDPKGEILDGIGTALEQAGYSIRCLNLVDFARSDYFNPLAYFNPEQAEVDCAILVQNFITNTSGQKPSNASDFWEKAERALLTALVAYVYYTQRDATGSHGTLVDVNDMLSRMSASESDENAVSDIDAIFEATKDLIAEMDNDPDSFDEESKQMLEGLRFACSQYNVYTQGAGETKKSVIISLGVRMAPLHMSALRQLLSKDTIHADRVGLEKTALFLVIPDTHATFSFLVSIFYELMFEKNIYIADHQASHRLPHQVHCFMDEFANIGKMPSFERKIAVMRSRGIATSIIMQTYSQGKALYKDDWETIVGNCDSLLFLGGAEHSTTEYISKRLGKQTIDSRDTTENKGAQGSFSIQYRTLGRELLTPDEIGRIETTKALYFLRGIPPFRSRKLTCPELGKYMYQPVNTITDQHEDYLQDILSLNDPIVEVEEDIDGGQIEITIEKRDEE